MSETRETNGACLRIVGQSFFEASGNDVPQSAQSFAEEEEAGLLNSADSAVHPISTGRRSAEVSRGNCAAREWMTDHDHFCRRTHVVLQAVSPKLVAGGVAFRLGKCGLVICGTSALRMIEPGAVQRTVR